MRGGREGTVKLLQSVGFVTWAPSDRSWVESLSVSSSAWVLYVTRYIEGKEKS